MYEKFYGLDRDPFRLNPDTRFNFHHKSYLKSKSYLRYALHKQEGIILITGQPGCGKTSLINELMAELADQPVALAHLMGSQMVADDLLTMILASFGVNIDTSHAEFRASLLLRFAKLLQRLHSEGLWPVLIVDEAQGLSIQALEELRGLTNLQVHGHPALQLFLIGQPGLREKILNPTLEQLHQRIVASCVLTVLNEEETQAYIVHRLNEVGWDGDPTISSDVYELIWKASEGNPRWINLLCSRLLLGGMVEEKHQLTQTDIKSVLNDLVAEDLLPKNVRSSFDQLFEAPVLRQSVPKM